MASAVNIIQGLKVLLKYDPDATVDAQHDVLYAEGPKPEKLEDNDRLELEELGWAYDVTIDSWRRFT